MRKQFLITLVGMTSLVAAAACSPSGDGERADGKALKVDVVAPPEPEIIATSGQLSVGELANGYDHAEAMARVQPEEPVEETGTSWNDEGWVYSEGTGPETSPKEQLLTKDPKTSKVTKVPDDYEG